MCASETSTFVPSPTHAIRTPSRPPSRSRIVSASASAWQGCSTEVSALITGIVAASAHCLELVVGEHADRERVEVAREHLPGVARATRRARAASPAGVSVTSRRRAATIATRERDPRAGRGLRRRTARASAPAGAACRSTLSSSARSRIASTSAGTRSVIRSRSRPASETGSGDFTATAPSPPRPPPLRRRVAGSRRRRGLERAGAHRLRRPARGRRGRACRRGRAPRRRRSRAAAGRRMPPPSRSRSSSSPVTSTVSAPSAPATSLRAANTGGLSSCRSRL